MICSFIKKNMIFVDNRILDDFNLSWGEKSTLITLMALSEGELSEGKNIYNCSSDTVEEIDSFLKSLEEKGYINVEDFEVDNDVYRLFTINDLGNIYE